MKNARRKRQSDLLSIIEQLILKQQTLPEFATSPEANFVLSDARQLVEDGEEGMAFENLTDNLYELGFPLREQDYQALDVLGKEFGFPEATWAMLRELVAD